MEASTRNLLSRLMTGPTMLLLGQAIEAGGGRAAVPEIAGSPDETSAAYERLDRAMREEAAPTWLAEITQYPWNGVFTSRIDAALAAGFTSDWRRVVPTGQPQVGRHPRSATELQIRYLFGGMGLPEDERPPMDVIQQVEARAQAVEVLNALADTLITPRGVVIIEGYQLGDWLTPQELFTFVTRLQTGQAHLFSASDKLLENRFIGEAVSRNLLTVHTDPFSTVLSDLEEAGHFQRSDAGQKVRGHRLIPVGDGFADVDVSTWNQVIGAARPIDTDLLEPFGSASPAIRYQRFRTFLGASEGAPPWKAVASGYGLRRDFEDVLLRRVLAGLEDLSLPEPIVVTGQTATGKTIALAALALEVARSGRGAVLHRSRRGDRPTLADIDSFAAWADEYHAIPTLLVWDGMANIDEYYTLQRQLRSRGRRVLIVGSSYLPPQQVSKIIRVASVLSVGEIDRVRAWLGTFGVAVLEKGGTDLDSSFLALLYRTLPETERGLRLGLTKEMRSAEAGLEKLSRSAAPPADTRLTAVAQALFKAGFHIKAFPPSDRPHADLISVSFDERSATEQLTSMVLTAGRRGLPVPLELALRILGRPGSDRIVELVNHFDIIRWTENESGGQYLGTRTQLEAELLAQEDLNPGTEVAVAARMIENLRLEPNRGGGGEEVQFIVDLMDGMGPQSQQPDEYADHYLTLADAFRNLRQSHGQTHHRLVLLEANLTREHVLRAQRQNSGTSDQRIELLREVQRLLEATLEEADTSRRARLNLLVELASTDGAQVFELSQRGDEAHATTIAALMGEVTRAALSARALDPENIYPVDVVAWATKRAVETGVLSDETRIDLLANAQASLDSIDSATLSPAQRAKYDQRQLEMSRLLRDSALEAKHLAALMDNSNPAAYYFLARAAAAGKNQDALQVAVQTLLTAPIEVRADWRCSRLLLDLFWELKTGKRFLRGEREVLAFSAADWTECITIADAIPTAGDFDRYRLDFLRGLSLFHLGSYRNSEAVFRELDQESENLSTRVVSTYLASDADGQARVFTGRVTWATPDGRRGKAWVDQLAIEVPFIPQRFSVSDFRQKGDITPQFHIAFNMRGALADPIRAPRRTERRTSDAR